MTSKTRTQLLKRLDPYWKMEAGNVVAIPAAVFLLSSGKLGWVTLLPLAAVVLLLVIGALYWRGKVQQLRGEPGDFPGMLRWIARLHMPALVLTLAGCAAALVGWMRPEWSAGSADRYAATACAILAVLEYVNYYHRQLQHFDNREDFRRMLAGKGFRKSWMARDLETLP